MIVVFYRKNKKKILALLLALAILGTLAFIFSNSLKSSDDSSDQSSEITEAVKPIVDPSDKIPFNLFEHHIRKLAHFTEFCLLGFELFLLLSLFCDGYKGITLSKYISTVFLTLVFALTDETIQILSDRGSSVTDVWIDFSGALTGTLISLALLAFCRFISVKKNKRQRRNR